MDSNRHGKVNTSSCVADSIQIKITKEVNTDIGSDHRLKESTLVKSKDNSVHSVNNDVPLVLEKIDKNKRQKLKSVLNSCIAGGIKGMNNLTDIKQIIPLIVQNIEARLIKPLDNGTEEDTLTLSQCVAQINELDPDTLVIDDQSIDLPLNSNPIEASISGTNTMCNVNDAKNSQSSRERHDSDESHSEIKLKPVDNQLHDLNNVDYSHISETYEVPEDETSNRSPVVTPTRTRKISSESARRSIRKIEKTNHKITEYFQKSKSKDPPVTQKSKRENIDPAFILTAIKGDPNYCIICKKTFTSSYLKTHLIEQHGIDKESIRSRSVKKENVSDKLTMSRDEL